MTDAEAAKLKFPCDVQCVDDKRGNFQLISLRNGEVYTALDYDYVPGGLERCLKITDRDGIPGWYEIERFEYRLPVFKGLSLPARDQFYAGDREAGAF